MINGTNKRKEEQKQYLKELLDDLSARADDIIEDLYSNNGRGGYITITLPSVDSPMPTYEISTEYYSKKTFERLTKDSGVK